jgi:hypothetical protein
VRESNVLRRNAEIFLFLITLRKESERATFDTDLVKEINIEVSLKAW